MKQGKNMAPIGTSRNKRCIKCFKCLKVYLKCLKCDAVYHAKCLLKVPGFQVDLEGRAFCCGNATSEGDPTKQVLSSQERLVIVKREEEYHSEKGLQSHLPGEEASETDEFKCDVSISELTDKQHLEKHYSERPDKQGGLLQELNKDKAGLVCPICNENNFQQESYEQHIKWCEIYCSRLNKVNDVRTTSTEGKETHAHSNERLFKCNKCIYTTKRRYFLTYHILSKHCDGKKWSSHLKYTLGRHLHTHTNQTPFKCNRCDYRTDLKGSLKIHMKVKHSNAEKETYKCSHCKYSTSTKNYLVMHMSRSHTNRHKCHKCSYATSRQSYLDVHILTKHNNTEKKHKCNDCDYSTHRKGNLFYHIRIHTNEKPFKCDTCNYAALRRTDLNRHILAKHSNTEKLYKCADCNYSTNRKESLVRHVKRIHTNERPFKCDTCDYASTERGDLNCHILAKHSSAEKKHKCSDCNYSSTRKERLEKHVKRVHTNQTPFKSSTCD